MSSIGIQIDSLKKYISTASKNQAGVDCPPQKERKKKKKKK